MPVEALAGPRVVLEDTVLEHHAVLVRDGLIEAIVPDAQVPADAVRRDLGDGVLTPGLIDIHTHGAAGRSFNEGTESATRAALSALLAAGVTTVLPTIATAPLEDTEAAVGAIASVQGKPGLPRVPGAHLEGPYFARAQCGAQDPDNLRSPDDGSVDRLLEQAAAIRMISYAPELPGAVALTRRLVAADIVAAAGHSDGRAEDLLACQDAGLRHVIHVFSGQSSTVRQGPWRQPGLLEATLTSDELTVEMIADGKHLPPMLLRLAHRCLRGRLCLVSDSTPGAGLPDGERYRMGEREYLVADGVGMTLDRTSFGGSTTLLPQMIPIALRTLGIGLPEAVAMASAVPARAAGLDDVGRIAPGCRADLALFTEDLTPSAVAVGGQWNDIDASTRKDPSR